MVVKELAESADLDASGSITAKGDMWPQSIGFLVA
jgi:hypothetical protein